MAYTKVLKPTTRAYTRVGITGRETYDEVSVTYDESTTFFDSINTNQYTAVAKPTSTTYTKVSKPT